MNSAAAKVAEIEDVLSEILIRLPAKSLMKFKCVSKQWNLLISSPQFGLAHGQIHRALLLNRGFKGIDELQVVPLKFSLVPSSNFNFVRVGRLRILQSCNGLLLCRSIFQNRPISSQYNNYVMNGCIYSICNPATAQSKTLSFPASLVSKSRFSYLISVGLAFDPISSPYYKIVFILDLHKKDLETYLVAIYTYSSENDSWNSRIVDLIEMRLGNSLPHVLGIGFQEGVYCKNGIHWLRTSNHPSSLLCFGVDDWSMKKMELSMPMALNIRYFGECLGNLYIIAYNHPNFEVVEIAPDYSEWVVKYSVNLQPIIECSPGDWEFWILGIVHEKNEERIVVSCTGGKIMSCNLKDGTWEMIYELDGRQRLSYQGECYKYFESLIRI